MKYKALSVILFTIAIVPSALAQRLETRSSGQAPGGHAMAKPARLTALSRLWQNEIQELPADHSALFAASREVSIELEVPSNSDLTSLDNALVTVIRPDGRVAEVRPDANGLVTVDQVQEGPHAFVVLSDQVHGAKLVYLNQATEQDVQSVPNPSMPLAEINGAQVLSLMEGLRDVDGPLSDLQTSLPVGPEFGYRVGLEPDGTMRGKILPIADRSNAPRLEGTRVVVFFRGIRIAEARSDGSGEFVVSNMRPGVYGMVVAGEEGYAAFAFEAVAAGEDLAMRNDQEIFIARRMPPVVKVPVVMIPPPMIPSLVQAIERYFASPAEIPFAAEPTGVPMGGFMASAAGGGGGGMGFDAAAGLLGLGAAIALYDDGNDQIVVPRAASPIRPGDGSEFADQRLAR